MVLMKFDFETWLIDVADLIIKKRSSLATGSLSEAERAVECMWLIDYSVRNSGSFGVLKDIDSTAFSDLKSAANDAQLIKLAAWLDQSNNEERFCSTYYERFDEPCAELKNFFDRSVRSKIAS